MMKKWPTLAFFFLRSALSAAEAAGGGQAAGDDPGDDQLFAARAEATIRIDGRLVEDDWMRAEPATDFRQLAPAEGQEATRRTEVRLLYGDQDLFVGATLYDDEPDRIKQTLGRRDEYTQGDWFAVSIDSQQDRKTAFQFAVSAAGVQYDALRAEDVDARDGPAGEGDASWNAIWESAVRITSGGWIVEMRIPYGMLRFPRADRQAWGVHFSREIDRLGERVEWPLVARTERANLVAHFGTLLGIDDIQPRRDLQVTPYVVSRVRTDEAADAPRELASETSADAGGDLKLGLGSNVTLNATINPDFGQVESDPAELNLTAFETFFDEKRPFFVEDMQFYRFPLVGSSRLLYTRRIGAEAPILGAVKVSGRTGRGLSFGLLSAVTGDDFDPNRGFGVGRVSKQIGEFSSAGAMLTGVAGTSDAGRPGAVTGGADWDVRFRGNTYSMRGFAAFSHRFGEETGFTGQIMAARRQGVWTYEAGGDFVDHRFDPNDLGRQRGNNAAGAIVRLRHNLLGGRSFGPFQRAELHGVTWQQWSYREGRRLGGNASVDSEWILRGFERISLGIGVSDPFGGYDLFETRGLWPAPNARSLDLETAFRTDERETWHLEPSAGLSLQDDGGDVFEAGLGGTWNVHSRIGLTGELELEWGSDTVEWASNESFRRAAGGWDIGTRSVAPAALGGDDWMPLGASSVLDRVLGGIEPVGPAGEYFVPIYGARRTRAADLILRASYAFSPDLILQLFSQVFVARGRYADYRILADPDTRPAFDDFPKRHEFTSGSFRLNMVLRWEYRPGSVLYVVWTQERLGDEVLDPLGPWSRSPYEASVMDQVADTFRIFPGNVFMVKMSYAFLN